MSTLICSSKSLNRSGILSYTPDRSTQIESMKFFDAICRDASLRRKVNNLVKDKTIRERKERTGFKTLAFLKLK